MAKLNIKVEVLDEEICSKCKKFKIADEIVTRKDEYGIEVEERKIYCPHVKLCSHLLEHIQAETFLHID